MEVPLGPTYRPHSVNIACFQTMNIFLLNIRVLAPFWFWNQALKDQPRHQGTKTRAPTAATALDSRDKCIKFKCRGGTSEGSRISAWGSLGSYPIAHGGTFSHCESGYLNMVFVFLFKCVLLKVLTGSIGTNFNARAPLFKAGRPNSRTEAVTGMDGQKTKEYAAK